MNRYLVPFAFSAIPGILLFLLFIALGFPQWVAWVNGGSLAGFVLNVMINGADANIESSTTENE